MNPDQKQTLTELLDLISRDLEAARAAHTRLADSISLAATIIAAASTQQSHSINGSIMTRAVFLAARLYDVSVKSLYLPTRACHVVFPRQLAMYLAWRSGLSMCAVARHFVMNHRTAHHACKQVENRIATEPKIAAAVAAALQQLQQAA